MGALFGVYARGGDSAAQDRLDALGAEMAHRGEDVIGTWWGEGVGLGLRLAHTTPESLMEAPPRASGEAGRLVLVGDCRIDNRRELSAELGGRFLEPLADSDLVLAAYERWGVACVDHLVGDFAFVLYDAATDELFCVRDHFGVKPFCYSLAGGRFAFASEARALVASRLVAGDVDEARIADFLLRRLDDKEATFYRDVRRLPPAHAMLVGRGSVRTWRYWQPAIEGAGNELDDEAAQARFRALFEQAVECRVRSIHPVGSFLSGGLDSSAVTLVANRLLAASALPLHAFSTVYPSVPRSDESAWMALAASRAEADGRPLRRHLFHGDEHGPLDVMEEMVRCLGAPSSAANLFQSWGMLGMARDAGVRIMLTGHDGDTVVSHGFAFLTELALAGQWEALDAEMQSIGTMLEPYGPVRAWLARRYVHPVPAWLWNHGQPLRALRALLAIHRRHGGSRRAMLAGFKGLGWLANRGAGDAEAKRWSEMAVAAEFSRSDVFRERADVPPASMAPSAAADHLEGVDAALVTVAFEEFDLVSCAFGIESRHPFFDKRLVEFCLSLPVRHKIREGWTRVVLRQAMHGVLPEEIRLRVDKSNLEHNFALSLRPDSPQLDQALALLSASSGCYWDAARLNQVAARYHGAPAARDALLLFLASGFGRWMSQREPG
jgi:asparagine synthase (glutamine-hydrolysing)